MALQLHLIFVKDRDGNERDVILGYDNVKSYEKEYCYLALLSADMQTGFLMQRLILMEWNISLRLMTMRTVFTVAQMVF